ncbi:HAMP domain-containing histidine kinase [Streptomyces sp. A108]|nr:HAMP domain-containing histidine kinase [Streptomyces sp. A108]
MARPRFRFQSRFQSRFRSRSPKGRVRISAVPLRRSLLLRLLAVSALVSVCSITATAWVVVQTTAVVLSRERGQALADDARIYDTLLGYAATHPGWDGVRPTVDRLARSAGHRIVLLGEDGRLLADSESDRNRPFQRPQQTTAVIDPLAVAPELDKNAADGSRTGTERIDPRAVGPFKLSGRDSERLTRTAKRTVLCLREFGDIRSHVQMSPAGRPKVVVTDPGGMSALGEQHCSGTGLTDPTPSETEALEALTSLVNACLAGREAEGVRLAVDGSWEPLTRHAPPESTVLSCLTTSRSQQLAPYVAPAALLYVSSPGRTATTFFDLSSENRLHIAGWAAAVLVVTVTVTTLTGIRLVKPLRTLTGAAMRMEAGEPSPSVVVRGGDEIAKLSAAFNSMSQRREQLESARRDMTNDIAHELRTPVSNIRGWLEAVEDGLARPDADLVSSLLGQALQLQHIVDDLRDLSAAEAGELRPVPEPVQVVELLSATAVANRATATAAGVTLTVVDDGPVVVMADPVRIRQMIGNLVSNAIRYTPAGGSVTLSARVEPDTVVIDVADTGTGIAADELPHIFDRFWRAEKSRSRQSGGSGLGLAIVRRLAEAHQGTVTVVSTPNVGSTFTLRLPRQAGRTA